MSKDFRRYADEERTQAQFISDGSTDFKRACRDGDADALHHILETEENAKRAGARDRYDTVDGLCIACAYVRPDCVAKLLTVIPSESIDDSGRDKSCPLDHACEGAGARRAPSLEAVRFKIVESLLRHKAEPRSSALRAAANSGRSKLVELLIASKASVSRDFLQITDAPEKGHVDVVQKLLDADPGPDVNNPGDLTSLGMASEYVQQWFVA